MPHGALAKLLKQRPLLVVIAGSNGAGKTTFYESMLRPSGLRFVNADHLAHDAGLESIQAAKVADAVRDELINQRETFITETVFSDPDGAKLKAFTRAKALGYQVVLIFIGIGSPERSDERVAMRVSKGGHDVPQNRIYARYPRTLANLKSSLSQLSAVLVYDHDDLRRPYRLIAQIENGEVAFEADDLPNWWKHIRKQG